MALVVKDRVQETSTTSGTGTLTLAGAVSGFQTFSSAIGNGNTTFYTIYDNIAQLWEVGIGTVGAGTLARTTVLSSSAGGTTKITLVGNAASVFCTYPAEQSVNLDASNNVSALGTISSGTWQGTTVGVAYGGTGVTASSGANSVVLRDANQNIAVNSVTQNIASTVSAAGTTTLTPASAHFQILTGTTTQTFKLPDATTLSNGSSWVFDNDSTGNLTVTDNANATVDVVAPGGYSTVFLEDNSTIAGTWGRFGMIPSEVNWGTNSLDLGGSTAITNGVWNGTPIAYNYGGTGLTTFGAANYALYSTSASALTAGTLPPAAGGTGQTTYTDGQLLIGNSTGNTLSKSTLTAGTGISVTNGNGSITIASTVTGAAITNDTSTATAEYPLFAASTSGTLGTVYTSNANYLFTPSTAELQAKEFKASNGIYAYNATIGSNYTIPTGYNALNGGPMTISTGATVTVSSGSVWTVL